VVLDGVVCWAPRLGIVHSKRCCGTVRTISVTVAVVALQQQCGSAGSSTNFCGANERFPAAVPETDDEL
jgi:hypothetical protein